MKVGDKVKLSTRGMYKHPLGHGNPHDLDGVLTNIGSQDSTLPLYRVKWSDGSENAYYSADLILYQEDYCNAPPRIILIAPEKIKKTNTLFLFHYYRVMIQNSSYSNWINSSTSGPEHLIKLCDEAIEKYDEFLELDKDNSKVNRWLGFIQGCLILNGLTTVEAERNFTRPLLTQHRNME